jgi:hypothetical protein
MRKRVHHYLYFHRLDSGRQQFLFTLVQGKKDVYNIVVGGRTGCNTFLSVQGCPSNYVTLQGGDDRK